MRAFTIDAFKTPGRIVESSLPEPGANEIRIRVTAAGVNPVDWKIRSGSMPDFPVPRVLGQDVAGIVDAVGSDVRRFAVGDRVVGCARSHGGYAEMTLIADGTSSEPVSHIPAGIDEATASALPTPGLTALGCLNAASIGAGTSVLIVGAAGAVGAIATQIAVLRKARVIATVRAADTQRVTAFGPERVVTSDDCAAIVAGVKAVFPDGVDTVLDFVSDGETLKRYADAVRPGATIVTTVHVADEAWFDERGLRAINLVMNQTPESSPAGLDELTRLVLSGQVKVAIGQERPLSDARAVLDDGEAHHLRGKAILRP